MKIGQQVKKIRSKNAGPFWITIDVFCGDEKTYQNMNKKLTPAMIAELYRIPVAQLKRFELPSLSVLKFSFPRTVVQGGRFDRDMHGAQMSVLLAEFDLDSIA